MEKLHWLWPNLLYETDIEVDDLASFNSALIKHSLPVLKDGTGRIIGSDDGIPDADRPPEVRKIKEAVLASTRAWLKHAHLDYLYKPEIINSYVGAYRPNLFLAPHYHDPLTLITLYYLTDEDENSQFQVSADLIPGQSRSTRAGHTVFMDPRGGILLRERPSIPGVFEQLDVPSVAEFCPKQGRMLTFAGHMLHWFMPTNNFRATLTSGVIVGKKPNIDCDG